jgi:hypothetical protein
MRFNINEQTRMRAKNGHVRYPLLTYKNYEFGRVEGFVWLERAASITDAIVGRGDENKKNIE